jgi:hypothetical protein
MRRGIVVPWYVLWLLFSGTMMAVVVSGRFELVHLGLETARLGQLLTGGGARGIGSLVQGG